MTVTSVKSKDVTCKTHSGQLAVHLILVNLASLVCDMDCWLSRRVSVLICGRWFDLQWWRSRYTLLMRPNKVKTAVQCFCMSRVSVTEFFGLGNSIYNIIPLL